MSIVPSHELVVRLCRLGVAVLAVPALAVALASGVAADAGAGRVAAAPSVLALQQPDGGAADEARPLTRETRQLRPVDVVCVVDDSGSEFGPGGTDPFALRHRACSLGAEFLATVATPGLDHRFGVVSFGTTSVARTAGLVPLPDGLGDVQGALGDPQPLGDTDYAGGIRSANQMFDDAEGRERIILLMGDGQPDVPGQSLEDSFAAIAAAVAESPAAVMVFQADPAGRAPDLEAQWASLGVTSAQRLVALDDGSLERAYVDALRVAVGMDRGDELHLTAAAPEATFAVPRYLEAVSLTWFTPTGARIEVTAPDGETTTGEGAVGSRRLDLPTGGRWSVRLVEGEAIDLAVDLVPVAATVTVPGRAAPVGREVVIEATFATTDGTPVPEVESDPRYFGAVVVDPEGASTDVELLRDPRGRYRATHPVPLDQEGDWQVQLVMKGRDGNVVGEAAAAVAVAETPWASIDDGTVRSRRDLEVPITLRLGRGDADAEKVLGEDPDAAVIASLLDSRGEVVDTVRADWDGGSQFTARFSRRLEDGERVWVRAELDTVDASGADVRDLIEVVVTGRPTSGDLWGDRLRLVALGLLALVVLLLVAQGAWLFTRPPLSGRLDLSAHGGLDRVRVEGGRWRRLDGRGLRSRWVWAKRDGSARITSGPVPLPFGARSVARARRSSVPRPVSRAS